MLTVFNLSVFGSLEYNLYFEKFLKRKTGRKTVMYEYELLKDYK